MSSQTPLYRIADVGDLDKSKYTVEIKSFPIYYYDEEKEKETWDVIGHSVFTDVNITLNLVVRSVIDRRGTKERPDLRENPPKPYEPVWFAELHTDAPRSKSNCRYRLLPSGYCLTLADALAQADAALPLLEARKGRLASEEAEYVDGVFNIWREVYNDPTIRAFDAKARERK